MLNQKTQRSELKLPQRQDGAVLIVGLMILVVMTLLSVTGVQTSMMNERMAANAFRISQSFQAAESASYYALNQSEWINDTLKYIDNSDYQWPSRDVELEGYSAESSVTMSARRALIVGHSISLNSDTSYIQLQTSSQASVDDGAETNITQGYVRVGAG